MWNHKSNSKSSHFLRSRRAFAPLICNHRALFVTFGRCPIISWYHLCYVSFDVFHDLPSSIYYNKCCQHSRYMRAMISHTCALTQSTVEADWPIWICINPLIGMRCDLVLPLSDWAPHMLKCLSDGRVFVLNVYVCDDLIKIIYYIEEMVVKIISTLNTNRYKWFYVIKIKKYSVNVKC